jgi:hypothetical protein
MRKLVLVLMVVMLALAGNAFAFIDETCDPSFYITHLTDAEVNVNKLRSKFRYPMDDSMNYYYNMGVAEAHRRALGPDFKISLENGSGTIPIAVEDIKVLHNFINWKAVSFEEIYPDGYTMTCARNSNGDGVVVTMKMQNTDNMVQFEYRNCVGTIRAIKLQQLETKLQNAFLSLDKKIDLSKNALLGYVDEWMPKISEYFYVQAIDKNMYDKLKMDNISLRILRELVRGSNPSAYDFLVAFIKVKNGLEQSNTAQDSKDTDKAKDKVKKTTKKAGGLK